MKQEFDLRVLFKLDFLHDQRICSIKKVKNNIVLHVGPLTFFSGTTEKAVKYYEQHRNFKFCDIEFYDLETIEAEIREVNSGKVNGIILCDEEFITYITQKKYTIEIIEMLQGFGNVVICGTFVQSNGYYAEDCALKIVANKMVYNWHTEDKGTVLLS